MNVYDFDGTIFPKDCTIDCCFWCMNRHPKLWFTKEWWAALCTTTRKLFEQTDIRPEEIQGLAFCSQMQGAVFVDENGNALRAPMNDKLNLPAMLGRLEEDVSGVRK